MKNCAALLEKAISENKADPKNLAYLTDRIAVKETGALWNSVRMGRKQEVKSLLFDDLGKVMKDEKLSPPKDFLKNSNLTNGRRAAGWIK